MQADPLQAEKLIALKLYGLNWIDRRWFIARLDKKVAAKVKQELVELKRMKVQNPQELLAQITQGQNLPGIEDKASKQDNIEKLGLSQRVKQQVVALGCDGGSNALALRKLLADYLLEAGGKQ